MAQARVLRQAPRFPVVEAFHGERQGSAGDAPDCSIALPAATALGECAAARFGPRGYPALRHLAAPGPIPATDLGHGVGSTFEKYVSGTPLRAPFDAFGSTPLHY
ncbi:hypothetical protein CS8_079080 [Cupriavidus sp. 8B]